MKSNFKILPYHLYYNGLQQESSDRQTYTQADGEMPPSAYLQISPVYAVLRGQYGQ